MTILRITLTIDEETCKQILSKTQYVMWKLKMKTLLSALTIRLRKFENKKESTKLKRIFDEEGEYGYILHQKKKFEEFMFAEESDLASDKYAEYKRTMSDRFVQILNKQVRRVSDKVKNKALRTALGGTDVLSFFSRFGILVKWELLK